MKTSREHLDAAGVAWPDEHPDTGAPFVTCEAFQKRTERREVRYLPPVYPTREYVTEWGEDGPLAWHTRTDAELTEAIANYEKAKVEYDRTGGRWFAPGATTITGRFATNDGAWAEGASDGKRWMWLEWATL